MVIIIDRNTNHDCINCLIELDKLRLRIFHIPFFFPKHKDRESEVPRTAKFRCTNSRENDNCRILADLPDFKWKEQFCMTPMLDYQNVCQGDHGGRYTTI